MFSSSLQRALRRGLAPDGDLEKELKPLRDHKVHSKKDAKAIVEALTRFPNAEIQRSGYSSPLKLLLALFQKVDGREAPAFKVLRNDGTLQLIRIFDELKNSPNDDTARDLLFLLKMLAIYETRKGAEKVVEAAQMPLKSDDFLWSVIFSAFTKGHPERDFVFLSLSNPIPPDFIAVALLDAANGDAISGDLEIHPFDTDAGKAQLRSWLVSYSPDDFSYAHSATAALPFLHGTVRDELLGLAREHADQGVCIEAAWASAKLGYEIGLHMLAEYSRDFKHSTTATRYLEELGREDVIPVEVRQPDFRAKAEFANWLAHPNELARPPDELTIVDHRELFWPPAGEVKSLWLIQYRLCDEYGLEADDVDCGLVGSTTWCFFSYNMHLRPPEDCYAIHCAWELGLENSEVDDQEEYAMMIRQWPHDPLSEAAVIRVLEIPSRVKYGRRLVALAKGTMNGEEGWAVLDGQESAWYAASEMPENQYEGILLNIHVGRRLLGLVGTPNRMKYLGNVPPKTEQSQFVEYYEKLLRECNEGEAVRKRALLADWKSPLGKHMQEYSEATEALGREPKSLAFLRAFKSVFDAIQRLPDDVVDDAYGISGPLAKNFEEYVNAMVSTGERLELVATIQKLEPRWNHNRGFGELGTASYKAGDLQTAERFFVTLHNSYPDWRRSEEMSLLAKIWHQHGKQEKARELLVECLKGVALEAKEATGSDRKLFERWYQNHRRTYLELFGDRTDTLAQLGLPESTLQGLRIRQ